MNRMIACSALALALGLPATSVAQSRPVPGRDVDVQRLRAEIEKVRADIRELEAKLTRAESNRPRGGGPGFAFSGGPPNRESRRDGPGPSPGAGPRGFGAFTSGGGGFGGFSTGGGSGFGGFGQGSERRTPQGPMARDGDRRPPPPGFGRTSDRRPGPSGRLGRGPQSGSRDSFERRLDRIIRELEQLRRDAGGKPG